MRTNYQAMLAERDQLRAEGNALLDLEERTDEEQARIEEITGKVSALNGQIATEERVREALRAAPAMPAVLRRGLGDRRERAMAKFLGTDDANEIAGAIAMADYLRGEISGQQYRAAYNDTTMNITTDADGKYDVPVTLYNQIVARRDEVALFGRMGVTNIPGTGTTVNVPIDAEADLLFTSVSESGAIGRDAPALGIKAFTLVKYGKYVDLTWEVLRDTDANLLAFVNNWIGRGLGVTENSLLVTEALASGTAALTLDAAAAIGETEIPEFVGLLAPEYQEGAAWLMKNTTFALIQGVGGTNNLKFMPAVTVSMGSQPTLWGFPVHQSASMPAATTGLKSLVFGNFAFMGRRQGTSLQTLRDPYSAAANGQVRLWFWFDCVYGVLQAEAINYATQA